MLRGEPLYRLQVQAQEKRHREGGAVIHERRQVRKGECSVAPEKVHREERACRLHLPANEHRHTHSPGRNKPRASCCRQQGKAVYDRDKRETIDNGAEPVKPFSPGLGPLSLQLQENSRHDSHSDGNIDEEDAPPAEVLREKAAEKRTERKLQIYRGNGDPSY